MTQRHRATFMDTYTLQRLDLAAYPINRAFGDYPYLVGSANVRADYRDVDVRLILKDDAFDGLFKDRKELWALMCYAMTAWLRAETRLPIDFQIQRMTEANKKYGKEFRNPLGVRDLNFAGYGDATNLWPRDKKMRAAYLRPKKTRRGKEL